MGRLDVDAMLAEMSSRQVAGWLEFYRVEPWGEYPAERRAANITSAIVAGNGVKCTPNDFMSPSWKTVIRQGWKDIKKTLLGRYGIKG